MNTVLISAVASVLGSVWGVLRHKNNKVKKIDEILQQWVPVAYNVVNNMITQSPGRYRGMGKTDLFIRELTIILASKGIKVTPQIITQAQAIADAMHYQDKPQIQAIPGILQEFKSGTGQG